MFSMMTIKLANSIGAEKKLSCEWYQNDNTERDLGISYLYAQQWID